MKTITQEAFLKAVSLLGDKKLMQDVRSLLDGETEDFDPIKAIEPLIVTFNNKQQKELIGKGLRKESVVTEALIRKLYPDFEFKGKLKADMLTEIKESQKANEGNSKDSKEIKTLQDALKLDFVNSHVSTLQEKADKYDAKEQEFNQYKNLQSVKGITMGGLSEIGGKFSTKQSLKDLQNKTLEDMLGQLPHKIVDGKVVVLDEDGDPLVDPKTSKNYEFANYLKENAPVEFTDLTEDTPDKKPPVIDGKNGVDFGYSKEQTKALSLEDYQEAEAEGLTQKAEFIAAKIEERAQSEQ
jgi:hypothetical protein